MNANHSFIKGLRDGIPIGLGYFSVSITFGMMAASFGIPTWAAVLISFTNLTSAGQFAGISLMASCAPFIEIALTQLVINIRYALMSLSLSQKADSTFTLPHRLLASHFITDEIFAVAAGQNSSINPFYIYGLAVIPVLGWTSGTFVGAAASAFLPEIIQRSLGIVIYGMFIAVIIPPAKKNHSIWLVLSAAVLLSCAFKWLPLFAFISEGFSIMICSIAAAALGAALFPVKEAEQ